MTERTRDSRRYHFCCFKWRFRNVAWNHCQCRVSIWVASFKGMDTRHSLHWWTHFIIIPSSFHRSRMYSCCKFSYLLSMFLSWAFCRRFPQVRVQCLCRRLKLERAVHFPRPREIPLLFPFLTTSWTIQQSRPVYGIGPQVLSFFSALSSFNSSSDFRVVF